MNKIKLFIKKEIDSHGLETVKNFILSDFKYSRKLLFTPLYLYMYRLNSFKFSYFFWKNLILSLSKKNRESYQNNTINIIKKINLTLVDFNELKILYLITLRVGLYKISLEIRKKMLISAKQYQNKKKLKQKELTILINSLFEEGDYNSIEKLIKKIKNLNLQVLFKSYYDIFIKKNNHIYDNFSENLKVHYGKDFLNFIKNKRLVINAPVSDQKLSKITKKDILVGMNFFNNRKRSYDLNYNISYLSYEQAIYNIGKVNIEKKINFIVTRNKHSLEILKKKYSNKSRYCLNFKPLLFTGNLNLMPNLILDLLFCPVYKKEIYVINSDLFISSKRIDNYYPKSWGYDNKITENFLKLQVVHDPITNFLFLSRCLKKNLINGDRRFRKILNNGLDDYIKLLESSYGIFIE